MHRRKHVQVQTVLRLVTQQWQKSPQILQTALGHPLEGGRLVGNVGQPLRAHRAEGVRLPDTVPWRWRSRRTEAAEKRLNIWLIMLMQYFFHAFD